MKGIKVIWMMLVALLVLPQAKAQIKDPTTWSYEAKRKYGNHFEVFFHLKLAPTWHIYALNPGGDGSMIAPSFAFDKNDRIVLAGAMKETTKPAEVLMEGIEGKVRLFNGTVTFVQEVIVKGDGPVTVSGSHEYQVCTDKICLPPKTRKFTLSIKP